MSDVGAFVMFPPHPEQSEASEPQSRRHFQPLSSVCKRIGWLLRNTRKSSPKSAHFAGREGIGRIHVGKPGEGDLVENQIAKPRRPAAWQCWMYLTPLGMNLKSTVTFLWFAMACTDTD